MGNFNMNRGFRAGYKAYSTFGGNNFRRAHATNFASMQFSTINTQMKLAQLQCQKIQATNSLITAIRVNNIITNEEAESGLTCLTNEDGEVEEDDGSSPLSTLLSSRSSRTI